MATNMLENFNTMHFMVMDFTFLQMASNIRASLKRANMMDKVLWSLIMEINMKVNGRLARDMERGCRVGPMEIITMEDGRMT